MTENPWANNPYYKAPPEPGPESIEAFEIASGRKPVGPNPDPEPPEPVTLIVEFTLSDGSTQASTFRIPAEVYATSMEVRMHRGAKNLGPILRNHFWFHDDSKILHTICRREFPMDDTADEPPYGPQIDTLEY